jgi:phosphoribosyl 1,2-cyclic phosphodiesterase
VEFGRARILVDAGLSAKQLELRLRACGVSPKEVACILLSHEHQDHVRGAELFSTRHRVPVACSMETLEAMNLSPLHFAEWRPLPAAGLLDLGEVAVESFPVPHDAVRPVGFVLHGEGLRVGLALDLGHATTLVLERLRGCHVLMVESNHDELMLRDGPYPWQLKQRVGSRLGHLSNHEAAALLRYAVREECRAVILAHLSEKNNTHTLARRAAAGAVQAAGGRRVEMRVAATRGPTPAVEL